jgi:hypothetical protein
MKRLVTFLLLLTLSFNYSVSLAATENEYVSLHKEIKPVSEEECKEEFITTLRVTQKDITKKIDLDVVIDASGSMYSIFDKDTNQWKQAPENWEMVKNVSKNLIDTLDPATDRASATVFQGTKGYEDRPSQNPFYRVEVIHPLNNQFAEAKQAISELYAGDSTPTASGLKVAFEEMESKKRNAAEKMIVLLTDGQPNVDLNGYLNWDNARKQTIQQAARIKNAGYKLFVVFVANTSSQREKDASIALLKRASSGEGYFYTTENFKDLENIFENIKQQIKPSEFHITEQIAEQFSIIPNSFTGDGTPTLTGNKLMWNVKGLKKTSYEFTYKLKRKSPEITAGTYPTTTQSIIQYGETKLNFPLVNATLSGECVKGSITVKYVDEEGNELKETIVKKDLPLGEYTEKAPPIEGYTIVGEDSHTFNLTKEKPNQEHTFVYKKVPKKGTVIVKYVDTEGKPLHEAITLTGDVGSPYKTEKKDFKGYEFVNVEGPPEGTFINGEIVVTYMYEPIIKGSITVKYADEEGNELKETLIKKDLPLGEYTENAPAIEGYELVNESSHTFNLTKKDPDQEHTFIYKKKKGTVIVKYVDTEGNPLHEAITLTGDVGSPYKTEKKDFKGYEFVKVEGQPEGTFIDGTIEVTYIYEKVIKGSITVKYVDEDGNTLREALVRKELPLGEYTENAPPIDGYTLVGENSHTFNLTKENPNQEHTFVYKKEKKKGTVITYYVDTNRNILHGYIRQTGEVGSPYQTQKKEFKGYEFVEVKGNPEGTFIDGTITVTYIYKPIIKGSITVKYVDEDGKELKKSLVRKDLPLETYAETAPVIEGYELVNEEETHTFNLTKADPDQEHTFIYKKKKGTVIVKYVDINGNALHEDIHLSGDVGSPYTTEKKEFKKYTFVNIEGEPEGQFIDGMLVVTYIYEKTSSTEKETKGSITVKYVDEEGNTIKETLIKKDLPLNEYKELAPPIDGYTLVRGKEHTFNLTKENPDQEHTFIYKKEKKKGTVIVKYVDTDGNKLHDDIRLTGDVGDKYTTDKQKFDGYEFIKVEGQPEGEFIDGEIIVTYIYKPTKKEPIEPEKPEEPEQPEESVEKLPQTGEEPSRLPVIGATFVFMAMLLIFRMRKVRNK